jgi:hypothetical protein
MGGVSAGVGMARSLGKEHGLQENSHLDGPTRLRQSDGRRLAQAAVTKHLADFRKKSV